MVHTKLDKEEINDFKVLCASLPSRKEITDLKELVYTNLAQFGRDNTYFKGEFEVHLGIIRRYDEVITQKASKTALYETELKLKKELQP
jgi:hypothetical protein